MRVFVSAGEASGDAYGAALVREIRRLAGDDPTIEFEGVGGPKLRAEGVKLYADSSHWGAIGVVQAIKVGPRVLRGFFREKEALASGTPGLLVAIDFGFANIKLCRQAKRLGWRVLYFIPPASWRRDRQGKDLPRLTDAISTPFSWSAEILNGMGADAHWFGHPIKQLIASRRASHPESRTRLAVLPGSRKHEIVENLPILAEALKDWPGEIEFALAPTTDANEVRAKWARKQDRFTQGDAYGVLGRAHAAVVCSGTATLEAALCRVPMVVFYRLSKALEVYAAIIRYKRPKFVALPNILMERSVVPELIQEKAIPGAIRTQLDAIWAESPERARQLSAFDELDAMLGPADAISRTAELAIQTTP